ncbi:uncharacterized protein SPSK_00954 [Sporothrix schenckii 1099-18]|uniref:Uncharacterized protein n=1 Tax=Sporothrix schenckii 1099-18 TaxID=1397361 RepID=A0A0F2LZC1_SPOSC|nr:uncharacterized protein SPSK_00954 [Sporothrix schenckii 1099-18]KJR81850.1 hypothetical protein SPSK_00954 [Sporothrix schenckii 1099-18]
MTFTTSNGPSRSTRRISQFLSRAILPLPPPFRLRIQYGRTNTQRRSAVPGDKRRKVGATRGTLPVLLPDSPAPNGSNAQGGPGP